MTALLAILGLPGARAVAVADAVVLLFERGREHVNLAEKTVRGVDGKPRTVMVPPAQLFDRIATAAHGGVFERQTPSDIVDRILTTPAPEAT